MSASQSFEISQAARSPLARFESGVAAVAGQMYVFGGHMEPELVATGKMFAYDPHEDAWSAKADAPEALSHVSAAVVDDRYIWVAGGFVGQHPGVGIRASYRYDTVDDCWDDGPPLPDIRASGGFTAMQHRLHYFGGVGADRSTNHDDHWVLDLNTATGWERASPVPAARTHAATAVQGDMIYAIGGHYGHDVPGRPGEIDRQPDLDFVHRYEPESDSWHEVAPLPYRRSHCEPGTFVHDGRIYCVGGRSASPLGTCLREDRPVMVRAYRIFRKAWRKVKPGLASNGVEDVICYDPSIDRWSIAGTVGHELYAPAAVSIGTEMIITNGGLRFWQDPSDQTMRIDLTPGGSGTLAEVQ